MIFGNVVVLCRAAHSPNWMRVHILHIISCSNRCESSFVNVIWFDNCMVLKAFLCSGIKMFPTAHIDSRDCSTKLEKLARKSWAVKIQSKYIVTGSFFVLKHSVCLQLKVSWFHGWLCALKCFLRRPFKGLWRKAGNDARKSWSVKIQLK